MIVFLLLNISIISCHFHVIMRLLFWISRCTARRRGFLHYEFPVGPSSSIITSFHVNVSMMMYQLCARVCDYPVICSRVVITRHKTGNAVRLRINCKKINIFCVHLFLKSFYCKLHDFKVNSWLLQVCMFELALG